MPGRADSDSGGLGRCGRAAAGGRPGRRRGDRLVWRHVGGGRHAVASRSHGRDGTADFGFAVDGRGIGPTIGNILEGLTFNSAATFNNRFGKGDNPGYLKLSAGLQGAWDPKWEFHLAGHWVRFHRTEPIEAEFRSFGIGDVPSTIGGGLDVLLVYKPQPQYQFRPFFSIFFPGSGAEKIAGADDPAIAGGVGFFAAF